MHGTLPLFPWIDPPRRFVVFRLNPSEHRSLARVWRRHPEHPKAWLAKHHEALAKIIERRLEEGSARIVAERVGYKEAVRWMAMQGWL